METRALFEGGVETNTSSLPLMAGEVRAGFPSPADDYVEARLNLIDHIVPHPSATFFVRAKGNSMEGEGIYDGDLLVVDRSLEPLPNSIIIIAVDGELTVKRYQLVNSRPFLIAGNPDYPPIPLIEHECHVWGVVTHNVHRLYGGKS